MTALEKAAAAVASLRVEARAQRDSDLAAQGLWPDRNWQPTDEAIARAVLMAVREPSDVVVRAVQAEQGDCNGYEEQAARAQIRAFIDAILNEARP